MFFKKLLVTTASTLFCLCSPALAHTITCSWGGVYGSIGGSHQIQWGAEYTCPTLISIVGMYNSQNDQTKGWTGTGNWRDGTTSGNWGSSTTTTGTGSIWVWGQMEHMDTSFTPPKKQQINSKTRRVDYP
jgi:hypothetical protein